MVASNGQTRATSEMHTRMASCLSAIASVQKSAGGAEVLDTTV
ncbi:MAG: YegP family protein [Acidimicrobiales bacterium]